MRVIRLILGVTLLTSACNADYIVHCLAAPVAVTANLTVPCQDNLFDFGHDLLHNPANPLPQGGAVMLNSLNFLNLNNDTPEWDLGFSFATQSAATTQVNFSVFPHGLGSGVSFFALGLSPSPFESLPPNTPNQSGSNFLVTESVSDLAGDHAALSICGGNGFPGCNGAILNQVNYGFRQFGAGPDPLRVMTTITDNAGDLTGFNEAFAVPEPATWLLLAAGLFGIQTLRRRRISHLSK